MLHDSAEDDTPRLREGHAPETWSPGTQDAPLAQCSEERRETNDANMCVLKTSVSSRPWRRRHYPAETRSLRDSSPNECVIPIDSLPDRTKLSKTAPANAECIEYYGLHRRQENEFARQPDTFNEARESERLTIGARVAL